MNWISRTILRFVRGSAFALAACTGAAALAAPAFAAPVIDGNIDDMVAFGQSLQSSHTGFGAYITDKPDGNGNPVPENIYNDLKFIPCPTPQPALGTHWVNGVEILKHVLAYESGSTKLYLGLRAEGFIGDSDGNGNPDNSGGGTCNPNDNIKDTSGISGNELYSWSFDLNCDGVTDGTILIQDNTVTGAGTLAGVTGTIAFRQGGSASGHDLELEINLPAPLPPAFNFLRVEANAFDGLSEDRSDGVPFVGAPGIAVAKTAQPSSLCVGQTTRFTITVSNTGQTSLSVVAVDQLPAQLSYAGNLSSSCGVGAPVVNGGTLTFPAFNLAAGANCTISFDALAGAQCAGSQNNVVDVTGTFTSACVPDPGSEVTTAHGEFAVVCRAGPCVQVQASGPPSACPGAPVTISGTVTNCSPGAETIVVKVGGAQAYNQSVGAGQTVQWSFQTVMPQCTAGQNSTFAVEASATTECGTDTKSASVIVACKSRPCVELTANPNPTSACPGTKITISGTVKNCSLDSGTIVVRVGGVQAFNQAVAAGVTVNWTYSATMPQCTAGQLTPFTVQAVATNDCDQVGDTKNTTVNVQCKNPPCAQLIDVAANKQAACPGEAIVVSGKVKNCGTDSATYSVTIGGVSVFSGTLAAGAEASFNREVTMTECVTGNAATWTVAATANNSCGNDTKQQVVSVACKSKPCVQLTAAGPPSACTGTQITISGKVHNCSLDSETIVVTVDGQSAFNGPVAAGADQNWSLQLPMKECAASQSVSYAVVATASSGCGQDQKTTQVNVQCGAPPCVALELNAPPFACAGTTIQLCGSVTNCSPSVEAIEVRFGDQQQRFDGVAPGTSRTYCFSVVMQACTTGDTRAFTVTAAAINDCGRQEKTAVDETKCKVPLLKVKKAGESTVADGATLHYTIIVENGGEVDLQNVFIRDTLCPYTVYNNNANPATFSAPSIGQNGTVVWKLDLLKAGESRALTFEARASLAAGGYTGCPTAATCRNNVDAEGSCAGSDGSQTVKAHDDLVTTITCGGTPGCAPKLTVDKTVSPSGPVAPGTTLHYTIKVNNPGTSAVEGVVATDDLCSGSTYANNANPAPGSAPSVGSSGSVVWNLGTIEAGGQRTLTFDAKIRSDINCADARYGGSPASCSNVVRITGHCGDAQAFAEDSVTSSIACAACAPKLSVEKTVSPSGPVAPGATLHYTIKVRNTGSDSVDGVVATDYPCDASKYAGNANPAPSSAPSVGSTGSVVWNLGTIEAGGTRTLTFDEKVREDIRCDGDGHDGDDDDDGHDLWDDDDDDDPADKTCTNVVKVSGRCGDAKAYAEAKASTTIQCVNTECSPKLRVEKTVTPYGPVDPGTTLHYTIKVSNPGSGAVDGAAITDYLCGVSKYAGNASTTPTSAPSVGSTGSVVWNIGTLEAGGTRTFSFDAQIREDVRCDGDGHDGDDDDGDDLWGDDGDDDDGVTCANKVKAVGHCGDAKAYAEATAKTEVRCSKTSDNCPHSCDDWKDDCSDQGSRYSHDQMVAIAERVDASSSFFNWTSGTDLSRFSAIVNATPSTSREKASRQFAVLLANSAVGELHLVGRDGSRVNLDANTPVHVTGFNATTIGSLAAEIDAQLVSLEGRNDADASVVAKYGAIASGCLGLNNGQGIAVSSDCRDGDGDEDARQNPAGSSASALLYRSAPNPFSSTTQFAYEVTGDQARVDITVYDVAGRQIRRLVEMTQPAGRYTAAWDGRSDDGVRVTRGVYFVRTVIAGTKAPVQRLLFLRDGQ